MEKLTPEQVRFFDTFGYLVLPGLMKDDIGWITEEFAAVFNDRGVVHDGTKRSTVVPFIDQRARLATLLDHPRIEGLIASLIGDDFNYLSGDGNYYSGDTGWHPDGMHTVGKYMKVAFYLDPVVRDTGALRVIPGSHRIDANPPWDANQAGKSQELWGVAGRDVPSVSLDSQPGDVVAFNHNLMHAAFGGSNRRRMFTMNCGRHAETPDEIGSLQAYIQTHCRPWGERVHSEVMRETATPGRMRHLEQVIAQGG